MTSPGDVTRLLRRWKDNDDRQAEEELFDLVDRELRAAASRVLRRTPRLAYKVDPRELVNEAYVRLRDYAIETPNRAVFFSLMAKAMRQYLLDLARRDGAGKRPPSRLRVVDTHALTSVTVTSDLAPIDFYDGLDALGAIDMRQAKTIELRVLGLTNEEIAEEQGVAVATVKRDFKQARAFLAFRLGLGPEWIQS